VFKVDFLNLTRTGCPRLRYLRRSRILSSRVWRYPLLSTKFNVGESEQGLSEYQEKTSCQQTRDQDLQRKVGALEVLERKEPRTSRLRAGYDDQKGFSTSHQGTEQSSLVRKGSRLGLASCQAVQCRLAPEHATPNVTAAQLTRTW
jgi:hypothetical protein